MITDAYRLATRARDRAFTLLAARDLAGVGPRTTICLPVRLSGEHRIRLGSGVYVGAGSWLQTLGDADDELLTVGDGCSIAGSCVLSAVVGIHLGARVLLARNVYVSDHHHAYADPTRAVLDQGTDRAAPVHVGDGAWLGQNVVLTPGVRVGRGAVVGAGAVVRGDVPDFSLAVGAPSRVVRTWASSPAPPLSKSAEHPRETGMLD